MPDNTGTIITLEKALAIVYDTKAIMMKARRNASKEEKLRINKRLARLAAEQMNLEGMIDALEDGLDDLQPPGQAMVDQIARLTGEVEKLAGTNASAAAALGIAGQVLDMAIAVTGD